MLPVRHREAVKITGDIYDGKASKFLLFPVRLCLRHVILLA